MVSDLRDMTGEPAVAADGDGLVPRRLEPVLNCVDARPQGRSNYVQRRAVASMSFFRGPDACQTH